MQSRQSDRKVVAQPSRVVTPAQFMERWFAEGLFEPQDHHHTGEPELHEPEGGGSVYHEEGKILANAAHFWGGPVLEIGTKLGISARYIAEGLQRRGLGEIVHTVDIDQQWPYGDGCLHPTWPNIFAYHCDSALWPTTPCKWAFVDGNHFRPGPDRDIEVVKRCGCDFVFFHDCGLHVQAEARPGRQDCSEARAAVLENMADWQIWEITTGSGLFFVTK